LLWLRLYSIPGGGRELIREEFEIPYCEVLTPKQAEYAFQEFKRRERINKLVDDVKLVGGNPFPLVNANSYFENIFNIRFRVEDVKVLEGNRPSLNADYYSLYKFDDVDIPSGFPDEVDDPQTYPEGKRKQYFVNVYERDQRARKVCLKKWGHDCYVCGMNFLRVYGPMGKEFIHVHHIKPLSEVREQYEVDGAKDLRPVCPNCHAMLHHGKHPLGIEELRTHLHSS